MNERQLIAGSGQDQHPDAQMLVDGVPLAVS
jgi:hypothetical protein